MSTLKVKNLTKDTLSYFKDCFDRNGSPKNIESIEWQFLKNKKGIPIVDISIDEETNQTAAIYAIYCTGFLIDGNVKMGAQSLDTMTDKDYRGKGLFVTLAKNVYDTAKNQGVSLVYGFPNGNSIHGFTKKLEWTVLDPVPFLIRPLRTGYFTSKLKILKFLPNLTLPTKKYRGSDKFSILEKKEFPVQVNDVWKSFSQEIKVAVNRDQDYLNWRYLEKPNEFYRIVHAYNEENVLVGFIVFVIKEKHNGKIGYIMELIYNLEEREAASQLMRYAVSEIRKEQADCILSWCLDHSPNHLHYKQNGFFKMPEKIRPIELHFGARALHVVDKELIENRKNWYLSYSDSDTV